MNPAQCSNRCSRTCGHDFFGIGLPNLATNLASLTKRRQFLSCHLFVLHGEMETHIRNCPKLKKKKVQRTASCTRAMVAMLLHVRLVRNSVRRQLVEQIPSFRCKKRHWRLWRAFFSEDGHWSTRTAVVQVWAAVALQFMRCALWPHGMYVFTNISFRQSHECPYWRPARRAKAMRWCYRANRGRI